MESLFQLNSYKDENNEKIHIENEFKVRYETLYPLKLVTEKIKMILINELISLIFEIN